MQVGWREWNVERCHLFVLFVASRVLPRSCGEGEGRLRCEAPAVACHACRLVERKRCLRLLLHKMLYYARGEVLPAGPVLPSLSAPSANHAFAARAIPPRQSSPSPFFAVPVLSFCQRCRKGGEVRGGVGAVFVGAGTLPPSPRKAGGMVGPWARPILWEGRQAASLLARRRPPCRRGETCSPAAGGKKMACPEGLPGPPAPVILQGWGGAVVRPPRPHPRHPPSAGGAGVGVEMVAARRKVSVSNLYSAKPSSNACPAQCAIPSMQRCPVDACLFCLSRQVRPPACRRLPAACHAAVPCPPVVE